MNMSSLLEAIKRPYLMASDLVRPFVYLLLSSSSAMLGSMVQPITAMLVPQLASGVSQAIGLFFIVLSLFFGVAVLGSLAFLYKDYKQGYLSEPGVGVLFAKGLRVFLVLLAYGLPYYLTLYIPGVIGNIITAVLGFIVIVTIPASLTTLIDRAGITAAFDKTTFRKLFSAQYWISLGLALVAICVYSLVIWLFASLLYLISPNAWVFYVFAFLYIFIYSFLSLAGVATAISLFARESVGIDLVKEPTYLGTDLSVGTSSSSTLGTSSSK
jgi:hypothetical protein